MKNAKQEEPAVTMITEILQEGCNMNKVSNNMIILLVSTVNVIGDVGMIEMRVIQALLTVLSTISNDELRVAINLVFKKLVPLMSKGTTTVVSKAVFHDH